MNIELYWKLTSIYKVLVCDNSGAVIFYNLNSVMILFYFIKLKTVLFFSFCIMFVKYKSSKLHNVLIKNLLSFSRWWKI